MKKSIIAATLILAASTAHASAMRIKNGTVLITPGDHISKVEQHLGRGRTSVEKVCPAPSSGSCSGWAWGIRHVYQAEGRTWFVDERDGVITYIKWAR